MNDLNSLLHDKDAEIPLCKCVVRLTTTYWNDKNGVYKKQSLRFLKKKCNGHNILYEDASNSGVEEVIERIVNLNKVKDGKYQVLTCNEHSDWETPNIMDDYDYKLVPLLEENTIIKNE